MITVLRAVLAEVTYPARRWVDYSIRRMERASASLRIRR